MNEDDANASSKQEPEKKPVPQEQAQSADDLQGTGVPSTPGGVLVFPGLKDLTNNFMSLEETTKEQLPTDASTTSDAVPESGDETEGNDPKPEIGEGETDAPISNDHIYPGLVAPNMLRRLFPTHPAERVGGQTIPAQNSYGPLPYLFSDAIAGGYAANGSFQYTFGEIDGRRIRHLAEQAMTDPEEAVFAALWLRLATICDALSNAARTKMVSSTGEPLLASLWPLHQFDPLPSSYVNTIFAGGGTVNMGALPGAGTPPAHAGHPDLYNEAIRMAPGLTPGKKLQICAMDIMIRSLRYVAAKMSVTTSWRA